jgi:DNA-binding transcriptional ArsR family regulator
VVEKATWEVAFSTINSHALTGICISRHTDRVGPFTLIADPHRRAILDLLREGERPVGELVDSLGLAQPAVSKHLRVLREAGVVRARVDAQRRVYRIDPRPLRELDAWLAPYRALWNESLDALEYELDAMTEEDDR